jgi:AcrR family transcriptional regulator
MAKKPLSTPGAIDWLNDTDWVYAPVQDRSRKTLRQILTTAKTLFVAKGFDETTVTEISRQSKISVGSIYHRFPDKQSILYAILETYRRTRFAEIDELTREALWQGKGAADVLDFHIEIIFSASRKDRGFFRLIERQRIVDKVVRDMQIEWNQRFCDIIAGLLRPHAGDLGHADIDRAVRYAHNIIRGSVMWSILPDQDGELPLQVNSDEYRAEARRMAAAYLGIH